MRPSHFGAEQGQLDDEQGIAVEVVDAPHGGENQRSPSLDGVGACAGTQAGEYVKRIAPTWAAAFHSQQQIKLVEDARGDDDSEMLFFIRARSEAHNY